MLTGRPIGVVVLVGLDRSDCERAVEVDVAEDGVDEVDVGEVDVADVLDDELELRVDAALKVRTGRRVSVVPARAAVDRDVLLDVDLGV